jgi:mannosylglucosylglycerate synthase
VSLTGILAETDLPCVAVHHDVLSEGAYKFKPTCDFAREILEKYFPPALPNISHWTINSRNREALAQKGIRARVIHDSMDFHQQLESEERARIRAELREKYGIKPDDIVLFVGSRIVPNKQTELAGYLAATLQGMRSEMVGNWLCTGELFSDSSRVVLVLAGRPERAFLDYQKKLFDLFDVLGIDWKYVGDDVRPQASQAEGICALYPHFYTMADFVLYPTGWEGFGNQLLEAFAAGLPVAVFEYPVFKEDIAPKGVKVVSLGDKVIPGEGSDGLVRLPAEKLERAAREIMEVLLDSDRWEMIVGHNIEVGKAYFSLDVLQAHLVGALNRAASSSKK